MGALHLHSATFSQNNIVQLIQNLDSSKAQGQDNSSIGMLKSCGLAIIKS